MKAAGLLLRLVIAWYLILLIPEQSRRLLATSSDWGIKLLFVGVLTVGLWASREVLRMQRHWYAALALGIAAPVMGFLLFGIIIALMEGPDESGRDLTFIVGKGLAVYLESSWFVILPAGVISAFILLGSLRNRPSTA